MYYFYDLMGEGKVEEDMNKTKQMNEAKDMEDNLIVNYYDGCYMNNLCV